MKVKKGSLYSIPYSIEINDIPAFLDRHWDAQQFCQAICDQFDVLFEDAARSARVMAICLHPFLIGHAYRSKWFDKALAHIASHDRVWFAKGGEIIDWYKKSYEA
jgi:hypothetical protein